MTKTPECLFLKEYEYGINTHKAYDQIDAETK